MIGIILGVGPVSPLAAAQPMIRLSRAEVESDVPPGTDIGALFVDGGGSDTWVFSLADDAGGRLALDGSQLIAGATTLDHAERPVPRILVEATNGRQTISRSFDVNVRQPLPKDAASLTFASNRVSFPIGNQIAAGSDCSALGHTYHVAPEYGIAGGMRLLFCNFYVSGAGGNFPEMKPGTEKTIDFATVFVNGTAYPVTFGGTQGATIPDGGFIWSDVVMNGAAELTMPARQAYYVRVSETTPAGKARVFNAGSQLQISRWASWSSGEGVEYSSSPQMSKRLTGTVAAFSDGTQSIAPHMIVGKGWDSSAVYAIFGDSIGAAQSDFGSDLSNRGVLGHIGLALDDIASGRRSYANFSAPGTRPQDQAEDADGQFRLRLKAIRALPNQPFDTVISRMGQNGIFQPVADGFPQFGATQPINLQNAMHKWWAFLHVEFASNIFQLTVTPRSQNAAGSNMIWTDPAFQVPTVAGVDDYPNGLRFRLNEWLLDADQHPAYVVTLDDRAAFYDTGNPAAFRPITGEWTLAAGIAANATSFVLDGPQAPKQGDIIAFEPGTANAEVRLAYRVTGTGPWTVMTPAGSKAHSAGVAVRIASSGDGLHPGHSLHLIGRDILISKKMDGTLP